jgi:hypothetical protein
VHTLPNETEYEPGKKVPVSGIYKIIHTAMHTDERDVTCIEGEKFPPCKYCGKAARFKLKYAALHKDRHPMLVQEKS